MPVVEIKPFPRKPTRVVARLKVCAQQVNDPSAYIPLCDVITFGIYIYIYVYICGSTAVSYQTV